MGHSQLFVRVSIPSSDASKTLCLVFEDVLYYEGPMWWQGADFRIGTLDEHLKIVERLRKGGSKDLTEYNEYILKRYHLFLVDGFDGQVQVLAAKAYKAANCPEIRYEPISSPLEAIDITPQSPTS